MHTFEEGNRNPEIYAYDKNIIDNNLNTVKSVAQLGFSIDCTGVDNTKDRDLHCLFCYEKSGSFYKVLYKFNNEADYRSENAKPKAHL